MRPGIDIVSVVASGDPGPKLFKSYEIGSYPVYSVAGKYSRLHSLSHLVKTDFTVFVMIPIGSFLSDGSIRALRRADTRFS